MDALHFKPDTLIPINLAGGTFLASLKANQSDLFAEMEFCSKQLQPSFEYQSEVEKAHGRKEQRHYWCYSTEKHTLINVGRTRGLNRSLRSKEIGQFVIPIAIASKLLTF